MFDNRSNSFTTSVFLAAVLVFWFKFPFVNKQFVKLIQTVTYTITN